MRISDLSRQSGVPVPTIKYYLREHLLPPGRSTGRNQAEYGDAHLRRLRLIRALTNVGQLELSSVRGLLAGIEDDQVPLPSLYEMVSQAVFPEQPASDDGDSAPPAHAKVQELIEAVAWQVKPDAPARARLSAALTALELLGCECGIEFFLPYAETAAQLTNEELDLIPPDGTQVDRAGAVVRAVLLDVVLSAIRRLAQEHYVTLRFGSMDTRPSS